MKKSKNLTLISITLLASFLPVSAAQYLQRTVGVAQAFGQSRNISTSTQVMARLKKSSLRSDEKNKELQIMSNPLPTPPISRQISLTASIKNFLAESLALTRSEFKDRSEHRKELRKLEEKELANRKLIAKEYNIKQVEKENKALKKAQISYGQIFKKWLLDRQTQRAQKLLHLQKLKEAQEKADLDKALRTLKKLEESAEKHLQAIDDSKNDTKLAVKKAEKLLECIDNEKDAILKLFKAASENFTKSHELQEKNYKKYCEDQQLIQEENIKEYKEAYKTLEERYIKLSEKVKETEGRLQSSNKLTTYVVSTAAVVAGWQAYLKWDLLLKIFS